MARPVGDKWTARPGVPQGKRCEPDPTPTDLANRAENAARRAVESVGIIDVRRARRVSRRRRHPRTSRRDGVERLEPVARPGT